MSEHITKASRCPECQQILNRASNAGESTDQPQTGDVSICIKCGALLRFRDNMRVTKCNAEDMKELASADPEIIFHMLKAQALIKNMNLTRVQNQN